MLTPVGDALRAKLPTSKDVFLYDPANVPAQPNTIRFRYGLIGHDSSIVCDAWKEGTCLFTIRDVKKNVPRAEHQVPHRPKPGVTYESPDRLPKKLFHRHSLDVLVCDYGGPIPPAQRMCLSGSRDCMRLPSRGNQAWLSWFTTAM